MHRATTALIIFSLVGCGREWSDVATPPDAAAAAEGVRPGEQNPDPGKTRAIDAEAPPEATDAAVEAPGDGGAPGAGPDAEVDPGPTSGQDGGDPDAGADPQDATPNASPPVDAGRDADAAPPRDPEAGYGTNALSAWCGWRISCAQEPSGYDACAAREGAVPWRCDGPSSVACSSWVMEQESFGRVRCPDRMVVPAECAACASTSATR